MLARDTRVLGSSLLKAVAILFEAETSSQGQGHVTKFIKKIPLIIIIEIKDPLINNSFNAFDRLGLSFFVVMLSFLSVYGACKGYV